jgi:hypothetical protein
MGEMRIILTVFVRDPEWTKLLLNPRGITAATMLVLISQTGLAVRAAVDRVQCRSLMDTAMHRDVS